MYNYPTSIKNKLIFSDDIIRQVCQVYNRANLHFFVIVDIVRIKTNSEEKLKS